VATERGPPRTAVQVRGAIVVEQYHRIPVEQQPTSGADRWFDTGDVATIDASGRMRITDRSKDVIKSGAPAALTPLVAQ
jgi:long-subunit acyl-CoA synthetase (AMP-forming)